VATTTPLADIPVLEGEAADAVAHRGGHLQIIASAGSGKTEVVSQRVASLLADGETAESIVAFTFTEKAADELKDRIRQRVTARVGESATDKLGRLFVGTIHAYCFRLLQSHVPRYETYTPLDANQLVNLLYRESNRLKLKQFDRAGKLFRGVAAFQRSVDVVENELLDALTLPLDNFRAALAQYYEMLDGYRFMSFGTQIVRAVEALQDSAVHAKVTSELRHLIVDEYQDVNPAQERLIELLAKPMGRADLVVVGDDDQAVYQWRGSNVGNIVTFAQRYDGVTPFRLLVNRRSRPAIVELADAFAQTIPERLEKQMGAHRDGDGPAVSFAVGFEDEETEADALAMDIEVLHAKGVPYRDIAILVRGKVAYPKILDALEVSGIPVQPGGRTGLFEQPEAAVFGATYAWLAGIDWAPGRFIRRETIDLGDLLADYAAVFALSAEEVDALRTHLVAWRDRTREKDFAVSLVGDFYALLGLAGVSEWDTTDEAIRNRLGTIGRFTNVLADYETVTRRSRRDANNPGEQVGGAIGDEWFYRNFALILVNYANGNYDDFDGEEDLLADGVALGTVHGAKGLEWPIVFIPSLTDGRFPSSKVGSAQEWLVPRDLFDASRYEGSDGDERRLFYVALTRARDWVALSSHLKVNKQTRRPSPYLNECLSCAAGHAGHPTTAAPKEYEAPDLAVTYSELAAYEQCPQAYLLRNQLGFMPPIQAELGYGNAVHHLMRVIAEHTQATGCVPTPREIEDFLTTGFYLPFANKPAHKEMREKARKLVSKYVNEHQDELLRTWATERPFELVLPGVVISGRADVIYDDVDGTPENLVIVDYKTSTQDEVEPLQLQVYADAGSREGLTVQGAVIEDMATEMGHEVSVDAAAVAAAEARVVGIAEGLKKRDFTPKPEVSKCRRCDVRTVCRAAKLK
jgi:ATP-dependent DNA helicase UvrD/PcrA